jgi:hypothetical protein
VAKHPWFSITTNHFKLFLMMPWLASSKTRYWSPHWVQGQGLGFLWLVGTEPWILYFTLPFRLAWLYTSRPRADSHLSLYHKMSNWGNFSKSFEWNSILKFYSTSHEHCHHCCSSRGGELPVWQTIRRLKKECKVQRGTFLNKNRWDTQLSTGLGIGKRLYLSTQF